jgi:NCS1 nucleoside transporter family
MTTEKQLEEKQPEDLQDLKETTIERITPWGWFQKWSDKLDNLGVETRGIERIQPWERSQNKTQQFISVIGFWISACGGLSSMSAFTLSSTIFQLTFQESLKYGLIGMYLGCAVAAYCSTMGPKSGCRQMVTARYLFGWWFVKFVAMIGCLGVLGWSIVNCVVGGQILAAVSNEKIPLVVGIIIVALLSFIVSIFGIRHLLKVEKYIAIPVLIIFMLLYIAASDKFYLLDDFTNEDVDPQTLTGEILSFFALCYALTGTWGTITADYYILFPENTPSYQVFFLTFFGIACPTTLVAVLGASLNSLAMSDDGYSEAFEKWGMGGLLNQGFSRWNGFGKFCAVMLLLSLIANNIINTYSAAFSLQLTCVWFAKVPRWIWAIIVTAFYLVCALVGRNDFATILGNFLPMIGYWISIYFILLLEENLIFRSYFTHLFTKEFPNGSAPSSSRKLPLGLRGRKQNYNWDAWNNYDVLTRGYAATFAFLCGVVGAIVGMCQVYYVGVLARMIGENGGDLGMWLTLGFSGVVYPWVRYWELKKFGR